MRPPIPTIINNSIRLPKRPTGGNSIRNPCMTTDIIMSALINLTINARMRLKR